MLGSEDRVLQSTTILTSVIALATPDTKFDKKSGNEVSHIVCEVHGASIRFGSLVKSGQ